MQVVEVQVGPAAEGMVRVDFRGEGDELISVKMRADTEMDGDAAVLRAKEMMVQVTSFGAPQEKQTADT